MNNLTDFVPRHYHNIGLTLNDLNPRFFLKITSMLFLWVYKRKL